MKVAKYHTYHVTMDIPNEAKTHAECNVVAVNKRDARGEASKVFFNHLFTGTYQYMKVELVVETEEVAE